MGFSNSDPGMDRGTCCAVYIDDRVKLERWIVKEGARPLETSPNEPGSFSFLEESAELRGNVELFLEVFKQVYLCNSGKSFAGKLAELSESSGTDCIPIFALFDIGFEGVLETTHRQAISPPSKQLALTPPFTALVRRNLAFSSESEESYGLQLLSRFSADLQVQDEPNLIVPIAILRPIDPKNPTITAADRSADRKRMSRCLDAGAVDVLNVPLEVSRVHGLIVHAYRVHKHALKEQSRFLAGGKVRKQSWVGIHDQQPYAYLREAMVSKLMKRICNPEEVIEDFHICDLSILQERKLYIEAEIRKWDFSAHDLSEDELVHAACMMLEHALKLPELKPWRISADELREFLLACRASYNSFVLYHNFRHAVDVLQSIFHFLLRIGILPRYPGGKVTPTRRAIASLLTPFEALTLLITAIGHDLGHPGVNNIFLVKLNAPLAQLYNDNSVLEAFHCAAFSQILRRHWSVVFKDIRLRRLMISSILATDMGVHSKFMESLGNLQEKYCENKGIDGWKPQNLEVYRTLLCGLLIKCADISNVARPWNIAEKWTDILQKEFANQGEMEKEVGMETALFGGPPELGNLLKLANGQINFMGMFASPLFEGVADLLPEMSFAANEIKQNKLVWQSLVDREKRKDSKMGENYSEGIISPRSQSLASEAQLIETHLASSGSPAIEPGAPRLRHLDGGSENGVDHGMQSFTSRDSSTENKSRQSTAASSQDSPVLTAAIDGSGQDEGSGLDHSTCDETRATELASSPNCNVRQGESRRCPSHRHFQRMSARASVPPTLNRSSEAATGTRTQSASTYTNNTVMTPISSSTQASSFVSDNGSDYRDNVTQQFGLRIDSDPPGSFDDGADGGDGDEGANEKTHVIPAALPACPGEHHHLHRVQENEKPSHFMATLIDKSFGNHHDDGITLTNPASSTSINGCIPGGVSRSSNPESSPISGDVVARTVPRRRSRLRLVFWRRNRQNYTSGTINTAVGDD